MSNAKWRSLLVALAVWAMAGCGSRTQQSALGGETHWLASCEDDAVCGDGLECICGRCTLSCTSDEGCGVASSAAVCETLGAIGFAQGCEDQTAALCVRTRDVAAVDSTDGGNSGSGIGASGADAGEQSSPLVDGWSNIAAGDAHACAISRGGELYCWGDGSSGQLGLGSTESKTTPTRVGHEAAWQFVAAGSGCSCALKVDGSLYCWGSVGEDDVDTGAPLIQLAPNRVGESQWTHVAAGGGFICGIQVDRSLHCWGSNTFGTLGNGTKTDHSKPARVGNGIWQSVAAGALHACGIDDSGGLSCWGYSYSGRLGIGRVNEDALVPTRVGDDTDWTRVSAGNAHTCGQKQSGVIHCWGYNQNGALGINEDTDDGEVYVSYEPLPVSETEGWPLVAAGSEQTCGVRTDGRLFCWGTRADVINDPSELSFRVPEPFGGEESWRTISLGYGNACGIQEDYSLHCWGYNGLGQIGDGSVESKSAPASTVPSEESWRTSALGSRHTCGVTVSGSLYCWGNNGNGQFGDGTRQSRRLPTLVGRVSEWRDVWAADYGSCAIKADGSLHCWGDSPVVHASGEEVTTSPFRLGADADFESLAIGSSHACAIKTDGSLFCWGWSFGGALADGYTSADGTDAIVELPVRVGMDTDWQQVTVGYSRTFAVKTNGRLYQWGSEFGSEASDPTVRPVGTASDWTTISGADESICGLRGKGSLYCWGSNESGQLGSGTVTPQYEPERVGEPDFWSDVSSGSSHTCAVSKAGGLYCWGNVNWTHQDIVANYTLEPTRVGTSSSWTKVSVGSLHTCATAADGTLHCWGDGRHGALGDGDGWRAEPTPVAAGAGSE